jgi:hypothetical protein
MGSQVSCEILSGRIGPGGGSPSVFGFLLLIIIPPLLHTHVQPLPDVCDSPEQAAHYQILGV